MTPTSNSFRDVSGMSLWPPVWSYLLLWPRLDSLGDLLLRRAHAAVGSENPWVLWLHRCYPHWEDLNYNKCDVRVFVRHQRILWNKAMVNAKSVIGHPPLIKPCLIPSTTIWLPAGIRYRPLLSSPKYSTATTQSMTRLGTTWFLESYQLCKANPNGDSELSLGPTEPGVGGVLGSLQGLLLVINLPRFEWLLDVLWF